MAGLSKFKTNQIIDVNLNRLQEGLKTIEDIFRFASNNKNLLQKIRAIRKDVDKFLIRIDYPSLIRARRTDKDPGSKLSFDIKRSRNLKNVLIRAFVRVKQALRILEEIENSHWKRIRFNIYQLEKVFLSPIFDFSPKLYAIWDEKYLTRKNFIRYLDLLIEGGIDIIQFRVQTLKDSIYLKLLNKAREKIPHSIPMVVNNRLDLALASGADGIHLGKDDLPVNVVREIGGIDMIIGTTVRKTSEIKKSEAYVDYIGVGSIFKSPTKFEAKVIGITTLNKISKKSQKPIIAIGGITPSTVAKILKAGADGIAVSSSLFEGNLKKNLKRFRQALKNSSGSR